MKSNTFWNKNNIIFDYVSLVGTNDIIIKRKTLLLILPIFKETIGNRKNIFSSFVLNDEKGRRVFVLIIISFVTVNDIIYISLIFLVE